MGHKVDSCNTDLHKLFYTPNKQWIRVTETKETTVTLPLSMTSYITIAGAESMVGDANTAALGAGTTNNTVHIVSSTYRSLYAFILGK